MKNLFTYLSFVLFISTQCIGQQVRFESSLQRAEQKSQITKKPLFIYVAISPHYKLKNYTDGLSNPDVVNILNSNFINYKVNRNDTSNFTPLGKKYHLYQFPTLIFLDSKGGLIKQVSGLDAIPIYLKKTIEQALVLSKGKSLVDYDLDFERGQYSKSEIEAYITKRINAGIRNNADIIEKYVDSLTINDLNDYQTALFILKAGPYVDGKAYRSLFLNRAVLDSISKKEPLEVRKSINNSIISNSLTSAINNKNLKRALATASFTQSTWGRNYREATKSYNFKMIQYYYGVKDTANYLRQASYYYDQYYMNISADSIKKLEKKIVDSLNKKLSAKTHEQLAQQNNQKNDKAIVVYSEKTNSVATELNNAAYAFYLTGTKNQNYLIKAMNWSKRAIQLNEISGFYDTLAHIYYQLGFHLEAESTQKKAIELAIKEKRDTNQLTEELKKMQNKTL